jgi:carbamoyltransferase
LRKDTELLRFDWICAGLQEMTEEVICKWIQNCIQKTGIRRIALSGGVFMNIKVNKCVMELDEVESLYVMPSCGDETTSFGAAYQIYYEKYCQKAKSNSNSPFPFKELYLGNDIDDGETESVLQKYTTEGYRFRFQYKNDIGQHIAQLLADKKVVARCKGRMEFGARALGNRSILADPSELKLLREVNLMVKKRDFWMPFAPVILKERASEYIVNPKNIDSPYMMMSYDTTSKRGDFIAAAHQADLTARPQIITEDRNPEYYRILKEFEKITGRGVLLNTSFNLHGFPIVYGPEEAMWVFVNSGLRYLAVGNFLAWKE